MLNREDHVVVVGAGLAGWRFIEALRREGYEGTITLIGDEPYAPYDRPPLSKQVVQGKWGVEKTTLASEEAMAGAQVSLRLGVSATDLDVATKTVSLSDGSLIQGTHVVIATGTRARRLPFSADEKLYTIRTRDDVVALDDKLSSLSEGATVVVIGGGFIGAEAATALSTRGFTPIVLEAVSRPLVNVLGEEVSLWLADLAKDAAVELRNGQTIADVTVASEGFAVNFANGEALACDAVIEGAGALVNTEWLASSGLAIDGGVHVDKDLIAVEGVAAIGDVARFTWQSTTGVEDVRIEHWQVANDHAAQLAHYWMTGEEPTAPMIPYFWSEQYGKKIQMLGYPSPKDTVQMVAGSVEEGKWVALYNRDGIVNGVVTLSQPRALMVSKVLLESPTTVSQALELQPWAS